MLEKAESIMAYLVQEDKELRTKLKMLEADIAYILDRDDRLKRTDCIKAQLDLMLILRWQRQLLEKIFWKLHDLKNKL